MDAIEALARGMRRLRRRHRLSQAQLAEAADLHAQYISQIERRQRAPTLEAIDAIAAALGVTAAQLLAIGESDAEPERGELLDRAARLLSSWPEIDQEHLIEILSTLHTISKTTK